MLRHRCYARNIAASTAVIGLLWPLHVSLGAPAQTQGAPALSPENTTRSLQLVIRGNEHYAGGRYQDALRNYLDAYALSPLPKLLRFIATCYQSLGEPADALRYWERYQATLSSSSPDFLIADQAIIAMKTKLDEQKATADKAKAEQELTRTKLEMERKLNVKRPRWRLGVGAGLTVAGGLLLGFGIPALAVAGRCIDTPTAANAVCVTVYDTQGLGGALTAVGGSLALGGIILMAWPPAREGTAAPAKISASVMTRSPFLGWMQ